MCLFFLKGLLFGLSISAPVGPMSLLCIRRTLAFGRTTGVLTGLGVATADGIFSSLAAFGIAVLVHILTTYTMLFRIFGASVLFLAGIHIILSIVPSYESNVPLPLHRKIKTYLSALFLALSNPLGILIFGAFFSGSGIADTGGNVMAGIVLVTGVALGSFIWWLVLTSAVAALGKRVSSKVLLAVNRISGGIIALFGLLILFQ